MHVPGIAQLCLDKECGEGLVLFLLWGGRGTRGVRMSLELLNYVWTRSVGKGWSCSSYGVVGVLEEYACPWNCSGMWFDKSNKSWKMGSGLGSPFGLEDKTHWMINFGGFTDSPHPYKQETRGSDTIQATSFFPWWLLLFFVKILCKKNPEIRKNPEKSQA